MANPSQLFQLLKTKVKSDLKTAMLQKNKDSSMLLKSLLSDITYHEKMPSNPSNTSGIHPNDFLRKLIKKRNESIMAYQSANRSDLVEKEKNELKIIESYFQPETPKFSLEETEKWVQSLIEQQKIGNVKELMKWGKENSDSIDLRLLNEHSILHFCVLRIWMREIGRGAHGVVYQASEKKAIKVMHIDIGDNESITDYKRILTEIYVLTRLKHPNIIEISNLQYSNSSVHIEMPYFPYTLNQWIAKNPSADHESKLELLKQLTEAIGFLHSLNLVHRDLKPQNILTDGRQLKLIDFALTKYIPTSIPTSTNIATIFSEYTEYIATRWYRPPEILLSLGHYGSAVDLWSLGCIAYELFNQGNVLFPGSHLYEQLELIMKHFEGFGEEVFEKVGHVKIKQFLNSRQFINCIGDWVVNFECMDRLIRDFIESLIVFEPEKRKTAKELLNLPLFKSITIDKTTTTNEKLKLEVTHLFNQIKVLSNTQDLHLEIMNEVSKYKNNQSIEYDMPILKTFSLQSPPSPLNSNSSPKSPWDRGVYGEWAVDISSPTEMDEPSLI